MTRLSNGKEPVKVRMDKPSPIKGMRVLIMVWGEKHFGYLNKALIPSLNQPKNLEALQGASIDLYSDQEVKLGIDLPVIWHEVDLRGRKPGEIQQEILIKTLRQAAETGERVLLAPPDTFFGEATIPNLIAANDPGTVVGFTHPRVVDTEFLAVKKTYPISNPSLVSIASQCLHPSFSESIGGHNSFYSGVYMKQVDNMWMVHHRIPTPYLVHPVKKDADLLGSYGVQGAWDHHWPEHLVRQGRWRLVGSSDLCFAVELTPREKNIPPLTPVDKREPDRYRGTLDHHQENRSFITLWRGV